MHLFGDRLQTQLQLGWWLRCLDDCWAAEMDCREREKNIDMYKRARVLNPGNLMPEKGKIHAALLSLLLYTVERPIKDTPNKEHLSIKDKSTRPNSYYTSTF